MTATNSREMTPIGELANAFNENRRRSNTWVTAAFQKVATETPEERAAALAREAEEQAAELAEQTAARTRYRRNRYEKARPAAYAESSLERLLPQQDPRGIVRGWLDSRDSDNRPSKNLLLAGPAGHGKTDAMFAIGNEAIERGLWVEAWSVVELAHTLSPLPLHARKDVQMSERQADVLDAAKRCHLLLLDDLGGEESGGFVADQWRVTLLEILSARDTEQQCRTAVTFNGGVTAGKPTEQVNEVKLAAFRWLDQQYDSRISSRLNNGRIGAWIEGEPMRKRSDWHPF